MNAGEKNSLREELTAANPMLRKTFDQESFYKVHWTKVSDLVGKRRVYLSKGQAYVPMSQQISLVLAEFNSRLDQALDVSCLVTSDQMHGADIRHSQLLARCLA